MVSFQRAQKGPCSSIICWEQRAAPPSFSLHCSSELCTAWKHIYLVCAPGTGFICFCPTWYIFQSGLLMPEFSLFTLENSYVHTNQGDRLSNSPSFQQNKILLFWQKSPALSTSETPQCSLNVSRSSSGNSCPTQWVHPTMVLYWVWLGWS